MLRQAFLADDAAQVVGRRGPGAQRLVFVAEVQAQLDRRGLRHAQQTAFAARAQPQAVADRVAGAVQRPVGDAPQPRIDAMHAEIQAVTLRRLQRQHRPARAGLRAQQPLRLRHAAFLRGHAEVVRQTQAQQAVAVAAAGSDACRRLAIDMQQQFDVGTGDGRAAPPFRRPCHQFATRGVGAEFELRRGDVHRVATMAPLRPAARGQCAGAGIGIHAGRAAARVGGVHGFGSESARKRGQLQFDRFGIDAADRVAGRVAEQQRARRGLQLRTRFAGGDAQPHRRQRAALVVADRRAEVEGFARQRRIEAQLDARARSALQVVVPARARPPRRVVAVFDGQRLRQHRRKRGPAGRVQRRRQRQPDRFAGHAEGVEQPFAHAALHLPRRAGAGHHPHLERLAVDEAQQLHVVLARQRAFRGAEPGHDPQFDLGARVDVVGQGQREARLQPAVVRERQRLQRKIRPFAAVAAQTQHARHRVDRQRAFALDDDPRPRALPLADAGAQARPGGFGPDRARGQPLACGGLQSFRQHEGHRRRRRQRIAFDPAVQLDIVLPDADMASGGDRSHEIAQLDVVQHPHRLGEFDPQRVLIEIDFDPGLFGAGDRRDQCAPQCEQTEDDA